MTGGEEQKKKKKQEIGWSVVLWYIHLHVLGVWGIWLSLTSAKWMTVFFTAFITALGCLGITTGSHRLWAHRAFTAKGSLRLFLMLAHTLTGLGPIYDWVLYHRLHHKYYGTDKDPYNHNRGFYYSYYTGNCITPVVDYEQAKIEIDMRDVEADRYVWIQKKFYWPLFIIFGVILPLNAPLEYWDETMINTIMITGFLRFAITTNAAWLVNSAPLIWGKAQGNKTRYTDDTVFFVRKSHWPLYHYQVPWDWKCGEYGTYDAGCSTFFIKMWHELGLIDLMLTATAENVRAMLYDVATKKISLENGLLQLKEKSEYNAKRETLLLHH